MKISDKWIEISSKDVHKPNTFPYKYNNDVDKVIFLSDEHP